MVWSTLAGDDLARRNSNKRVGNSELLLESFVTSVFVVSRDLETYPVRGEIAGQLSRSQVWIPLLVYARRVSDKAFEKASLSLEIAIGRLPCVLDLCYFP